MKKARKKRLPAFPAPVKDAFFRLRLHVRRRQQHHIRTELE